MESNQMYSTPNNFTGLFNRPPFMNDLNETDPLFDLTLSQQSNCSTCFSSSYVNYEETQLDEDNEDTPIARGNKKGQSADNFDSEEDKLLVSGWLNDNIEAPKPASLKRPIGRKTAKGMNKKKAKTIKEVGENDDALSKVRMELEELRAWRLENARIRAERFQLLLAIEQKHVELAEKTLELQARREKEIEVQDRIEEDRIMAMDTSDMSPIQVEYFERRRKEIFAKQTRRFENI